MRRKIRAVHTAEIVPAVIIDIVGDIPHLRRQKGHAKEGDAQPQRNAYYFFCILTRTEGNQAAQRNDIQVASGKTIQQTAGGNADFDQPKRPALLRAKLQQ